MFSLDRPDFPVDAHVWKLGKALNWLPANATRVEAYEMLNVAVPDDIKYELHVLMVMHGKRGKNELGVLREAVWRGEGGGKKVKVEIGEVEEKKKVGSVKVEEGKTKVKEEIVEVEGRRRKGA